jgi:hypothetical protein
MARGHDYLGLQIVYALPLQVGQAPFLPQEAHSVQLRLEPVGICEDRLLPPRVQPLTKMLQTCVGFNIDCSASGMLSTRRPWRQNLQRIVGLIRGLGFRVERIAEFVAMPVIHTVCDW